jgi:hypothetical protein
MNEVYLKGRRMTYPSPDRAESSARSHARCGTPAAVHVDGALLVEFVPVRWITYGSWLVEERRCAVPRASAERARVWVVLLGAERGE